MYISHIYTLAYIIGKKQLLQKKKINVVEIIHGENDLATRDCVGKTPGWLNVQFSTSCFDYAGTASFASLEAQTSRESKQRKFRSHQQKLLIFPLDLPSDFLVS